MLSLLFASSLLASAAAVPAWGPIPDKKTMTLEAFHEATSRHDAFHDGIYQRCMARCTADDGDGCAKTRAISDPSNYSPTISIDGECLPRCELPWHLRVMAWTCREAWSSHASRRFQSWASECFVSQCMYACKRGGFIQSGVEACEWYRRPNTCACEWCRRPNECACER